MPDYNVERYLPRRINSILSQTFTDFELVLIDRAYTYRNYLHKVYSENAAKSAKDLTWENYERNLTTQLKEKIWRFTQ